MIFFSKFNVRQCADSLSSFYGTVILCEAGDDVCSVECFVSSAFAMDEDSEGLKDDFNLNILCRVALNYPQFVSLDSFDCD